MALSQAVDLRHLREHFETSYREKVLLPNLGDDCIQ
jgi:hypothetical protein